MTLVLRRLSKADRDRYFARGYAKIDPTPFLEAVREMEGGVAYGIVVNGTTARSIRLHMNRAAKSLGLSLRWAKLPKDAREIMVELADA